MAKANELTGRRFGRLAVIERAENDKSGKTMWRCRCDCGNEMVVVGQNLLIGRTLSCGCLRRERAHGKADTRLHRIWTGMKTRCSNPKHHEFHNYGGRGIRVCAEWENNFMAFYEWALANGYQDRLTIDRENNNAGYSPENCRWATEGEQQNNRRTNHLITHNGKTQSIAQWAAELGIKRVTLQARLTRYHWDIEKAMSAEDKRKKGES
jgi:hypothetical protein